MLTVSAGVVLLGLAAVVIPKVQAEINREDSPARFAELAGATMKEMLLAGETPSSPSNAECLFAIRHRELVTTRLAGCCRELAPIAREDLSITAAVKKLMDRVPSLGSLAGAVAVTTLGVVGHSGELTRAGASRSEKEYDSLVAYIDAANSLHDRVVANNLELVSLAPKFCGPIGGTAWASWKFQESGWGSDVPVDTLTLTNESGVDLHDCVLLVRVKGSGNETFSSARFCSEWQNHEVRIILLESTPFRETARSVQRIEFQVWAREQSFPAKRCERPANGW